jgi:hypothetical protein
VRASGLHLSDFDGAWRAVRAAVAARIRLFGAAFTDAVHGDSRATSPQDSRSSVEIAARRNAFSVVVYGGDTVTEPALNGEGVEIGRIRRYPLLIAFATPDPGADSEDDFLDALELAENRFGAMGEITVDIDGAGTEVVFSVAPLETVAAPDLILSPEYEVLGFHAMKSLSVEVVVCG